MENHGSDTDLTDVIKTNRQKKGSIWVKQRNVKGWINIAFHSVFRNVMTRDYKQLNYFTENNSSCYVNSETISFYNFFLCFWNNVGVKTSNNNSGK